MKNQAINEFAKALIEHVRDRAIRNCDQNLAPGAGAPVAKRWASAINNDDAQAAIQGAIADCVDETIFCLLNAIDQGQFPIAYGSTGDAVDLGSEGLGELSGWYMGSNGWRSQFSKERYFDDFSDLT